MHAPLFYCKAGNWNTKTNKFMNIMLLYVHAYAIVSKANIRMCQKVSWQHFCSNDGEIHENSITHH